MCHIHPKAKTTDLLLYYISIIHLFSWHSKIMILQNCLLSFMLGGVKVCLELTSWASSSPTSTKEAEIAPITIMFFSLWIHLSFERCLITSSHSLIFSNVGLIEPSWANSTLSCFSQCDHLLIDQWFQKCEITPQSDNIEFMILITASRSPSSCFVHPRLLSLRPIPSHLRCTKEVRKRNVERSRAKWDAFASEPVF